MNPTVRHLVAFRVPNKSDIDEVVDILAGFAGFDGVRSCAVERDLGVHPPAYDVLLVTEHESVEDLTRFRKDPDHVAAAARLSALVDSRVTIDHSVHGQ